MEWNVAYVKKQGNSWRRGTEKVKLFFQQANAGAADIVVHNKGRYLVRKILYSHEKWTLLII